jgi:WD40 repeat protein
MRRFRIGLLLVAVSLPILAHRMAAAGASPIVWLGGGHIGINDIAVSPNQAMLASCSATENTAKLWRTSDGVMLRTLAAHLAGVSSCAFSPDGSMLATAGDVNFGSGDVQVKLWNVAAATVIRTFDSPPQTSYSVSFSPDGTMLAAGQGPDVTIWRVADGTLLHTLTGHSFTVFAVAWSPDGQIIASGSGDRTVKLWRVSNGTLIRTLTGHTNFVNGVAFAPNGLTLVSAGWDQAARLWRLSDGALLQTLSAPNDALYAVAYSPDGTRIVAGGSACMIRLYDAATGGLVRSFTDPGVQGGLSGLVFATNTTLWSGSYDSHARRWRVADGTLELAVGHHTGTVASLVFSPDGGRIATGSHDFTGHIWDVASAADLHALVGHIDVVNSIAWSQDMSQVATASGSPPPDTRDTTIKVWNPGTGALIRTLQGHLSGSTAVDYTPDNQFLISGGRDNQVKYWRQSDGALVRRLFVPRPVDALQISPNGAVVAVAVNNGLTTFDVVSGALLRTIPVGAQVVGLDWSPDNRTVALALSAYGDNVRIYDTTNGTLTRTMAGDPLGFEQAVAYSADGQTLYSGSGYTYSIQVWRVSDGALLATYDREAGWGQFPTMSIDVHPSAPYFAYGRNDATVVLSRDASVTAVSPPGVQHRFALEMAPNPISETALVSFTLPAPARIELEVVDVGGRLVRRLVRGQLDAGRHVLRWDGAVRPGVYFVALRAGGVLAARHRVAVLR